MRVIVALLEVRGPGSVVRRRVDALLGGQSHRKRNLQHPMGPRVERAAAPAQGDLLQLHGGFPDCSPSFLRGESVGANGIFLPTNLENGGINLTGAGFLDPDYKSPRSIQMNIGVQRGASGNGI